jgi:hypothetical protein
MTIEKGVLGSEEKKPATDVEILAKRLEEVSAELARQKTQQPQAIQSSAFGPGQISELVTAAVTAALAGARKERNYDSGIEEQEIEQDDYDEKGVKFYSPTAGYILTDDKRKGQIVVAPYKRQMFFEHLATRRQGSGKHETTAPISMYVSHSRKITEWIRNHTLYGSMFYETESGISHDDAQRAKRTAQIMTVVKGYETPELIRACNELNVPKHENYDVMRQRLVFAMAEREIEANASQAKAMLHETYKSNLLMGRVK